MTDQTQQPVPSDNEMDQYVRKTYENTINYYRGASTSNKKNYKRYRSWTIILGALVTLIASLTTSRLITSYNWLETSFSVATPLLAATLTIINGLSQNFQWGATWRDMVVNSQRLQKEYDRYLASDIKDRNFQQELQTINDMMLEETQTFFQRVLDSSAAVPKSVVTVSNPVEK